MPPAPKRTAGGWFLLAAGFYALIVVGTLTPRRQRTSANLIPFVDHLAGIRAWLRGQEPPWALVDIAINLVLFIPFTVALARGFQLTRGTRAFALPTLLMGVCGSLLIELAQLFTRTRAFDVTDVLLNSLGAAIGVGLMRWASRERRERTAKTSTSSHRRQRRG